MHILGVPEGSSKRMGLKKIFEERMAENLSKFVKRHKATICGLDIYEWTSQSPLEVPSLIDRDRHTPNVLGKRVIK